MRQITITVFLFASSLSFGQIRNVIGKYSNVFPRLDVTFYQDSTFEYNSKEMHPTFYRWEEFSEKGKWTLCDDTVILNPNLTKKIFVESVFIETKDKNDSTFLLTFNHIKRYFDEFGHIVKSDSSQIDRLDYSFNEWKRNKLTRVTPHRTVRCSFAGYIPKEVITTDKSIAIVRPIEKLKSIFIGCYELQGTKEFIIKNNNSNRLILNVYSNYYADGQIRQMKFLVKNDKVLYTRQYENGTFEKDSFWNNSDAKLKRQKVGK